MMEISMAMQIMKTGEAYASPVAILMQRHVFLELGCTLGYTLIKIRQIEGLDGSGTLEGSLQDLYAKLEILEKQFAELEASKSEE